MPIIKPLLPPKAGYVEIIDENGDHVYTPTPETIKRLEREQDIDQTIGSLLGTSEENPEALEFRKAVQIFAETMTDESSMMQIASVYPEYKIGTAYKIGDKFKYGTNSVGDPQLYQVLQDHASAAEWTPDTAVSLYKKIGISEEGIPIWVQPLGATDAYNISDQVMYNNVKYESVINANVWSPDAYPAGWKKVEDVIEEPDPIEPTDPSEPELDTTPEFIQPTGAHDAYNTGDIVMYNGKKYESTIDNNVWSPDTYPTGWKLIS